MKLSHKNWNKPSNRRYKRIADILLYSLPLYLSAVMAMPVNDLIKAWVNFVFTVVIITIKTITKFTADDTIQAMHKGSA